MAATRRLTELVDSALARTRLPPGSMTVALSGGADSAALAFLAARSGEGPALIHIHHGLAASDMLAAAASAIAQHLGLQMHTVSVDVPAGPSLEAQARDVRYGALATVDGAVITGHTRDDLVETVLINLVRGSGAEGLSGIPYHRPPNVYRPILDLTRSETREIAALAELPFRDDPSNDSLEMTRNRVRHRVLPVLRDLNPRVDEALARAADSLRADSDFIGHLANGPPAGELEVSVIATAPRPVADRLVMRWLATQGVPVTAELLARVWAVVGGDSDRQDLEGGRSIVRDRAVVRVE